MDPRLAPLLAGGLPFAVSFGLLKALKGRAWAPALSLGAGYAAGHLAVDGLGPFPPVEGFRWLWMIALAAVVAKGWVLRVLLLGSAQALSLRTLPLPWAIGFPGLALASLWVHGRAARLPGAGYPLLLCLGGMATGLALFLSGSQRLALLAGSMTGAALAWLALSCSKKTEGGTIAVPAACLPAVFLLASGCYFTEMPLGIGLLLLAIPACGSIQRTWPRLITAGSFAAGAVAWAVLNSPPLEY